VQTLCERATVLRYTYVTCLCFHGTQMWIYPETSKERHGVTLLYTESLSSKRCTDLRYLWNRTVQRTTQNFGKLHLHDSCIAPALEFCRALLSDITVQSSPVGVDGWYDVRIIFHENSSVYLEIGDYVTVNRILLFWTVHCDIHM